MGVKLKKFKNTSSSSSKATPSKNREKGKTLAGGKASTRNQKIKKNQRGPKAYITDASDHLNRSHGRRKELNGTGSDGEDSQEGEEEDLAAALEAEDMVGAGADSTSDRSDGEEEEQLDVARSQTQSSKGKAKRGDGQNAQFLLNLDKKAISRSRAEEARLKKAERKEQRADVGGTASRAVSRHRPAPEDESDAGSTDMEGASESSDGDDFDGAGSDDDFDSQVSYSDESQDESDDSEDGGEKAERLHAERLKARRKRDQMAEAQEAQVSKRKRLPIRGTEGKWTDDDSEGESSEASSSSLRPAKKTSKAIHAIQVADALSSEEEEDPKEVEARQRAAHEPLSTITSGARFGLQAPYSIMLLKPRSARVAAAREQIARLSTDIVGDPEVSVGLLRRLSVFAQDHIVRPEHDSMAREKGLPTKIAVDDSIRGAALLSLTAIYVDVLPGYRIRALTDKEKEEKVNQETSRRREYEQGLVDVYRTHLETCEKVLRSNLPISSIALRSMCILLTRATHFNYRTNLTGALVSQLSRRSWSADSQLCADSLIEVLRRDLGGEVSLEVVRLLNRMTKERHYKINAKVLNILLHLRLKDELGGRRSGTVYADRIKKSAEDASADRKKFQSGKGKAKPRDVRKGKGEHLSKKQVKTMREVKEAEKDMKEAEAEIDKEERDRNQTETLKLLFVLYFSILKADEAPAPLLGAALEGLARFAHRVNVDFFRDLLAVLRKHVEEARANALARNADPFGGLHRDEEGEDEEGKDDVAGPKAFLAQEPVQDDLRKALLCLVTAFELLSGQGEALNIDLSDMVGHLYSIMLPLCSSSSIEEVPIVIGQSNTINSNNTNGGGNSSSSNSSGNSPTHSLRTDADLLLRAIDLCLLRPRLNDLPSERSAAMIKRMLLCSLYTPPTTTLRLLGVVRSMIGKDPKLEALLDTEDRAKNGRYDAFADDVEAARPLGAGEVAWELHLLRSSVNEDIRIAAEGILAWQS